MGRDRRSGRLPAGAVPAILTGLLVAAVVAQVGIGALRSSHRPNRVVFLAARDPAPARVGVSPAGVLSGVLAQSVPTAPTDHTVSCVGNGTSGDRIQAVYAHTGSDRFSQVAPFIRTWAAQTNDTYEASAAETAGTRQLRFVTKNCSLSILDESIPAGDGPNFDNEIATLQSKGLKLTSRKYLIWTDFTGAGEYCGLGQVQLPINQNNNGPGYASVEPECWGELDVPNAVAPTSVEAHEITHALGAVAADAPHRTSLHHCTDEYDAMCYIDKAGVKLHWACPSTHSMLLDCNHDDYFSTAPKAGSYLATHWNAANNQFLVSKIAPANDNLASAEPLFPGPRTYVGTNLLATKQAGEPAALGVNAHSVWFSVKAPSSAFLTVDTQGSSFDTVLGVYTGTSLSNLHAVAANDDAQNGVTWSRVVPTTTKGTTYWIKVDGKGGKQGVVILHVGFGGNAPRITSISPTSGPVGTVVTINGTDLFQNNKHFEVYIDGFVGPTGPDFVGTSSPTQLKVKVPSTTLEAGGNAQVLPGAIGPVEVIDNIGVALSLGNFKVTS